MLGSDQRRKPDMEDHHDPLQLHGDHREKDHRHRPADEAQALSAILSRMKSLRETRHTVRGRLTSQRGKILGDTTLLPRSGVAQYRPSNSKNRYTLRQPGRTPLTGSPG